MRVRTDYEACRLPVIGKMSGVGMLIMTIVTYVGKEQPPCEPRDMAIS